MTGKQMSTSPGRLPRSAWAEVLRRTLREAQADNVTDWAAALTYYGVLSLFPALLVLVAVLGLLGDAAVRGVQNVIRDVVPAPSARDILLTGILVLLVFSGRLSAQVGRRLGVGEAGVTAWDIGKWPVLVLLVSLIFTVLYWAAPNARQRFRWISPGGIFAVLLWAVVSAGFALYVSFFASYNRTYGSLAGVIVFLVWLSDVAILLGAELSAELERERTIRMGGPADREPYVSLRDDRKLRKRDRD
ncbi:YihY/virulence factor BrkB family protein [Plantactinospora sp. KLBMP9567]|uniref:YihY/virulence factor BrkB family protein n=1 Tax=Plantactinospora sp. KLBMP9567 TaxID=3085900 RepID=UPI002980BDC4|nr:YihY/virulence factor BrkB family protein [Plantactinospora sp. KLBMP9567]MDW5327448.1 YihY/virulence factor BrkB family protein [Plantactinospora sp. KLBMP9567]